MKYFFPTNDKPQPSTDYTMESHSQQRGFFDSIVLCLTSWLTGPLRKTTQSLPDFIPDVDPIPFLETCESAGGVWNGCRKAKSNHHLYIPFNDLELQHLPTRWRNQDTLQHIRDIGQRVVKLRVKKLSRDRPGERKGGHNGTGFVTYDSNQGAPVVHTNRHVVYDQFEASQTEVTFFYEGDSDGIQCQGSIGGFHSTLTMDYSSFALMQPLPEAVVTWQKGPMSSYESDNQGRTQEAAARKAAKLDQAFSLSNTVDSFYRSLSQSDNVVIISHPHGGRKQVSVGEVSERYSVCATLYTTPTCPGSSGAPLLRFNDLDSQEVIAGRILHQGDHPTPQGTAVGVGEPRPSLTFLDDELQDACRQRRWAVTFVYQKWRSWRLGVIARREDCFLVRWFHKFRGFLLLYGLFCIVGPSGVPAVLVFLLGITHLTVYGAGDLQFTLFVAVLSLSLAAQHGVTKLAYVLVPPDDRGWLCTAIITLACFLTHRAMCFNTVIEFVKSILPILARFCWFPVLYGLFCIVGPPWTLAASGFWLAIIIPLWTVHGWAGLRFTVFFVLSLSLSLATMHGVTELAYVLVPPDDRDWLWTALLTLSYYLIYCVIYSTPVDNVLSLSYP